MFQAEHDNSIVAEVTVDDRQHVVEPSQGDGYLRQHQEMEFFQVPFAGYNQFENRAHLAPLLFRVGDYVAMLGFSQMIGDLGNQAVQVMAEGVIEIHLFVDDLDHKFKPSSCRRWKENILPSMKRVPSGIG